MKTCIACGVPKADDDYYLHPKMASGRLSKCKECCKKHATTRRKSKLNEVREYDRKRGDSDAHRAAVRRYSQTPEGRAKLLAAKQRWAERNKHKKHANVTLNNALRDGRIFRAKLCERCGLPGELEAHHPDYSRPLEVQWVHDKCHKEIHKEARELARQEKR